MSLRIEGPATRSLADTPFEVRVTGAVPHDTVTFLVNLPGFQGADWFGRFTAVADEQGVVDL